MPSSSWLTPQPDSPLPVVRVIVQEADPARGALLLRFRDDQTEHATELVLGKGHESTVQAAADILAHWAREVRQEELEATLHGARVEGASVKSASVEGATMESTSAKGATLRPAQHPGSLPTFLSLLPSYMVNVSALTHFDFCPRNYLMDRYSVPDLHPAQIRGNLVHEVFEPLLQEPQDRASLMRHFGRSLHRQVPQMVMAGTDPHAVFQDSRHHLNTLFRSVNWLHQKIEEVFAERFFLDPELGLKGKIDALVRKKNGRWQALELKTGKSWGQKANRGHAYQVAAYQLLLLRAGFTRLDPPGVLYTGDGAARLRDRAAALPPRATLKNVSFGAREVLEHVNLRNDLVRIDITGTLDFNTNDNKCRACVRLKKAETCLDLHHIGLDGGPTAAPSLAQDLARDSFTDRDRDLFRNFNQALLHEFRTLRCEHGRTLLDPLEKRVADGRCVSVRTVGLDPQRRILRLSFPAGNTTEIREGEPCLLSDEAGVLGHSVLEVWVASIDKEGAAVRLPKGVREPWFQPCYLDANSPETAFARNFAALYQLWSRDAVVHESLAPVRRHLRGQDPRWPANTQVAGSDGQPAGPALLPDQKRAVALARGLEKLLLVQGPPGTGKTLTLACMVRELANAGKRVLVATYTHRAAEEVMAKLHDPAAEVPVRKLGRVDATSARFADRCLDSILQRNRPLPAEGARGPDVVREVGDHARDVQDLLAEPAIYVGTVQTWISGAYDNLGRSGATGGFPFDVAVVDEAAQIITPAMVGVLRLAPRWILVGDHQQLPPVILADDAQVLQRTLFESLAMSLPDRPDLLVSLGVQHRMPPDLGTFISREFYDGKLTSAPSCAEHVLPGEEDAATVSLVHCPLGDGARQARVFPQEAETIVETLKTALEAGLEARDAVGRPRIGIIAPYRRQVALLRRQAEEMLAEYGDGDFWEMVINSVDRFQGDERDLIFLSLCLDSHTGHTPRVYRDARRVNVALSRARARLCVVGDLPAMDAVPVLARFREAFQG